MKVSIVKYLWAHTARAAGNISAHLYLSLSIYNVVYIYMVYLVLIVYKSVSRCIILEFFS